MTRSTSQQGAAVRAAAARAVDSVLTGGESLDTALARTVDSVLAGREQTQARALAYGSLRWHSRSRLIIRALLDKPLKRRDQILEALLSVGLLQLMEPRQPGYAVVSATVDAARQLGIGRAAGLVNAALRRFQREQTAILDQVMTNEEGRFSHPQWLIDLLRKDWPKDWSAILESALEHPPLWLRVNQQQISTQDYQEMLRRKLGIDSTSLPGFPDALRLADAVAVEVLPGFGDGLASVQDAAAQLAVELLEPAGGMRILDACAAPGGKASHILERAGQAVQLVALDIDSTRLRRASANFTRLRLSADVVQGDALQPAAWWDRRPFDRILLDAPCSATGVIRRHPDIRFLRRPTDVQPLAARQMQLLEALWPLLKPGGSLLYATCSVLKAENDAVLARFLVQHDDARARHPLGSEVLDSVRRVPGGGYQCLPGAVGLDGFYYALMSKEPG
jgi:16S rRNA (cytosine967-C5)-methyltransferase